MEKPLQKRFPDCRHNSILLNITERKEFRMIPVMQGRLNELHENLSFTSVRGEFHQIWYEDLLQIQKHADGEFGYLR